MRIKHITLLAILLSAGALSAQAANPFRGVTSSTDDIRMIATAAGALLGGLFALIGGARAGWKAAHSEEFTKDLIFAIVGFVIGIVCVVVM